MTTVLPSESDDATSIVKLGVGLERDRRAFEVREHRARVVTGADRVACGEDLAVGGRTNAPPAECLPGRRRR